MFPVGNETAMIRALSLLRLLFLTMSLVASEPASVRADVTQHDIVPILLLRCAVCHGARKQEGDLDLRSRAAMLRGGKSGPALVPGKPDESRMLKRILAEECPPRPRLIEAT